MNQQPATPAEVEAPAQDELWAVHAQGPDELYAAPKPPKEAQTMAMQTTPTATPRRFIKLATVKDYTSLSTSEIYRRIAAGTFPKQITLGPKSVVWDLGEVLCWCDQMAAQREVA